MKRLLLSLAALVLLATPLAAAVRLPAVGQLHWPWDRAVVGQRSV